MKTIALGRSPRLLHLELETAGYALSADLEGVVFEVSGSFYLEELITSCSGLLCQVARALKGRRNGYDRELQRIMGY